MDSSAILEATNATAERLAGLTPWQFTWATIRKGACTMLDGAKWTLFHDGTATFEATVTSDSDDGAWTIWHVDLLDHTGTILGSLTTDHPVDGDWRKFIQPMPFSAHPYHFRRRATFDRAHWNTIVRLKMYSSW
jgi:hypothetical protein